MWLLQMAQHEHTDGSQVELDLYGQAILDAVRIANMGVCITMPVEGTVRGVHVSDAALAIVGRTREEMLSRNMFDFVAPEDRQRLEELHRRRLAGEPCEPIIETEIIRGDGRRVPIAYAVAEPPVGTSRGIVVFFWDISSRRAEEARLRRVIESAPDGIVISRNGVVLDANPAAARLLGYDDAHAIKGVSLHALMSPVDTEAMTERVAKMREGVQFAPRVYEAKRRDGSRIIAEITSVPYEHDGQLAVMGFARDVTYRAKLEAQLVQSERLVALGTLAAGVAHEINNPLAVMSLSLEDLANRLSPALERVDQGERKSIAAAIDELRAGVDRVAGIIRELRAFSRTDTAPPGPTNVLESLAAAERMTTHQLRHHTRVCTDYGVVPLAMGHAQRLEQVFVNLLINAAQALPEGRAENRIDIRAYVAADGRVAVEIKDNGSGMDDAVLPRVFDPFFTTKSSSGGTGLGLSISHGIVKQLSGEIVLESQVGVGTTARVLLNAVAARSFATPSSVSSPRATRARSQVLIVDDEPSLLTTLRMLIADDHDVTTANSGEAACAILLSGRSFDVVLCDMMMPGVTGMDVYARVAHVMPELLPRFVFMTGGACTERAAGFLAQNASKVLEKPFTVATVRRVIFELTHDQSSYAGPSA